VLTDSPRSISPRRLRDAVGHFATGVTVVTARDEHGTGVGATVNSMTSVSLDPPLVLICLQKTSRTLAALMASRNFAINVLKHDQETLARRFAAPETSTMMEGAAEPLTDSGPPRLRDALATLECAVHDLADGGDHRIVVGRVTAVEHRDHHIEPLLFYRGRFTLITDGARSADAIKRLPVS
jgi:flavin reductase (DIM6/NTAB) family NADH-FMN oxidoreductase RutF